MASRVGSAGASPDSMQFVVWMQLMCAFGFGFDDLFSRRRYGYNCN